MPFSSSRVIALLILLTAVTRAGAVGRTLPPTTAELLVDLARDHALRQRGQQTPTDVAQVRTLLKAALRLDPKQTDAYVWLYEFAELDGDKAEAARLLTALLEADPTHQGAFARWLLAGARAQQTVEQRAQWLQAVAATSRPPALAAMVHVELARLALERADVPAARQALQRARELEPADLDAAVLGVQVLDSDTPPPQRLAAYLHWLQLSPLSIEAAAGTAAILDEYGLATEAGRFFDHAVDMQFRTAPGESLPAEVLLARSRNLHARGQTRAAIDAAVQAVTADPAIAAEAGIYIYYLQERDLPGSGDSVRTQLAQRFAAIREPNDFSVNEVAQAAWFYLTIDAQPDRALRLARAAADRAPGAPFVQRVLGWAQAVNQHDEEASALLTPLATRDAYAAYMLARLKLATGDSAAARGIIAMLQPRPVSGPAADWLAALESEQPLPALGQPLMLPATRPAAPPAAPTSAPASQPATAPVSQPASPAAQELQKVLATFDARALTLPGEAARYVEATVALEDRSLAVGESWWAVFTLTNRAPFPITLGADGMIAPTFVLSFSAEGDRKREFPALMTVDVDRVRVLHPGESVSTRRTLDIGPLRVVARETPQQMQRITLRALLDGMQADDGTWQPAPGGQILRPVYFNRIPASTSRDALTGLFNALSGGPPVEQVRAIEVAAELISERQRADLKRLEYRPEAVPADRLEAALVTLLASDSWELRVRTLDALQIMGLSRRVLSTAEPCLEHPHWLVRLMAVRLLARQGSAFAERAASVARNDTDELVRDFAQHYVAKWQAAKRLPPSASSDNPTTSAPADAPPR